MSTRGEKKTANAAGTAPEAGPDEPLRSPLVKILEADVIPQLAASRGIRLDEELRQVTSGGSKRRRYPNLKPVIDVIDPTLLSTFVDLLLKGDQNGAWHLVEQHQKQHGALGFLNACSDLLEPAAQALGEMWIEDDVDFHQVTQGCGHLQALLRRMPSGANPALTERVPPSPIDGHYPRIMLLPAAGEQHTLGVSMLGRAFSDAGWLLDGGPGLSRQEALKRASQNHFDLIGISISCAEWIDEAAAQVQELRKCSQNPDVQIIVGGPLLSLEPNLVSLVGADDSANDLHSALEVAAAMLERCVASDPC